MSTTSPSPNNSPQERSREIDPHLVDLALSRIGTEKKTENTATTAVAKRLFDEFPPPLTSASLTTRTTNFLKRKRTKPKSAQKPIAPRVAGIFPTPDLPERFSPGSSSPFTQTCFPSSRSEIPPPMPPTPGFKIPIGPTFPGNQLLTTTDSRIDLEEEAPVSFGVAYNGPDGQKHTLLKQPIGSKSCFAYSFVMLLSDLIRSGKSLQLNVAFWTWFQKAYLLYPTHVQAQARIVGVELELTDIPFEDPLAYIRGEIEKSGFPVLTTIEHPEFSGHAIVIDSVTATHTTIRDPFSGKAWEIPNEKMKSYYEKEKDYADDLDNRKCLSVKQP